MLPADVGGDVIELSSYDGRVAVAIDGAPAHRPIPELTELGERREGPDFTLRAERLDETTWSVDVSPL